ncbi:O-antigen ligase family protein [Bradyrhizobium sp.]|uniref:O-antigen ligase family protein n=1 Tax=Bradyrhizobium sp. TaxID=376 RepID=UPI001DE1C238|nr:O-antigen ligase family protein [Bradyrhizobium sp.]MBI5321022.1 O-antigen ligase family protein [Bradyrhizobium sp.]
MAARRDPAAQIRNIDLLTVLIAVLLPWSTSGVAIASLLWLIALIPTLDVRAFAQSLKRPVSAPPIALFVLALAGTLWSDAPWGARLYAVGPAAKLLVLPLLLYHFERTPRGKWVFVGFLVSCALMLAMSWIVAFAPAFTFKPVNERVCGVFVKNYIDQSQEFALCALALAFPVMALWKEDRRRPAAWLFLLALAFVANMVFVIASRTALATMPLMLAVFAFRYLPWRGIVAVGIVTLVAGAAWATAPRMCRTIDTIARDFELYQERNIPTSAGLRIEYWTKSLRFIGEAPLVGHGTGSIRGLFEKAATGGAAGASAQVVANPHNQTLSVAIQWGAIGVVLLYAMWLSHLLLFRGEGLVAWVGLLVVVQNVLSSLFNSHLFDFHEGWMYVLGVGVAGGTVLGGAGMGGRDGVSAATQRGSRDSIRPAT